MDIFKKATLSHNMQSQLQLEIWRAEEVGNYSVRLSLVSVKSGTHFILHLEEELLSLNLSLLQSSILLTGRIKWDSSATVLRAVPARPCSLIKAAMNIQRWVNFFYKGPYKSSQLLNSATTAGKQPLTICKQMAGCEFGKNYLGYMGHDL